MRSRTAIVEPREVHARACALGRARQCSIRLDGRSWSIETGSATVADVLRAFVESGLLDEGQAAGLRVGERFIPPHVEMAPPWYEGGDVLHVVRWSDASPGADVHVAGDVSVSRQPTGSVGVSRQSGSPTTRLLVSSGPGAGGMVDLWPGRYLLGRDARCEVRLASVAVSARHAELHVGAGGELSIADLGTTNGTCVGHTLISSPTPVGIGDVVTIGPCRLAVLGPRQATNGLGPRGADGRRPFYRAARMTPAPTPVDIAVPAVASVPTAKARFNWIAVVVPLVMGLALAVLFSPAMALFSLLGPVMSVANYQQERSKIKAQKLEAEAAIAESASGLAAEVARQRALEIARREFEFPDPGLAMARSSGPMPDLWDRRIANCSTAIAVNVGRCDQPWRPGLRGGGGADAPGRPETIAEVLREQTIADAPVHVGLRFGAALGVVAQKPAARGVARSIVAQLANLFGPGELKFTVLADLSTTADIDDWSWVTILPHTQQPDSSVASVSFAGSSTEVEAMLEEHERSVSQRNATASKPLGFEGANRPAEARVVVVEVGMLSDAARSTLGRLVEAGSSGKSCVSVVALAPSSDLLPSFCSDVLTVTDADVGLGELVGITRRASMADIVLSSTSVGATAAMARRLAAFRDPESADGVRNIPASVSLVPMLGLGSTREEAVRALRAKWSVGKVGIASSFSAVLGVGEEGPFAVDFVSDGPHALVGGTTGSGKSELLRSLVVSIASTYGPADANFVLVDYKGGSAFDVCANLPHVVGMVTDLDEQLGERALMSLEAELRWREHLLRDAGAPDYLAYRRESRNREVPLARLMVIIDEFATMAKELPDFLAALIGIAQRGRSLGVHMILATQRPSGVVNENIKANTNLRIALRVQDANDSQDVLGSPVAAGINRRLPGRAFARLGPGELVRFQAARVHSSTAGDPANDMAPVTLVDAPRVAGSRGNDSIEAAVEAVRDAWVAGGAVNPRRPWLEPLPRRLRTHDVASLSALKGVVVGLLDDPSKQTQRAYEWHPREGNVALVGLPGGGASGSLLTFAHQCAATFSAADLHLYGLDFGEGILGVLSSLPHTGSVVAAGERDRLTRVVRFLRTELDRRRGMSSAEPAPPTILVLIDNFAGLIAAVDEISPGARDDVARLIADGPGLGCCFIMSADRPGAFPIAVSAAVTTKIVFRLADASDVVQFGIERRSAPAAIVGRAVALPSKLAVQLAEVHPDEMARLGAQRATKSGAVPAHRIPRQIRSLPDRVTSQDIADGAVCSGETWFLPFGLGDENLEPVGFALRPGEHVLVTSPAHSGKSTALRTIGRIATAAGATVSVIAYRKSAATSVDGPVRVCASASELSGFVDEVRSYCEVGPHLLLIDDAELVDDPDGVLVALVADRIDNLRIVVAARADVLRSKFGHWTVEVRRSRVGLVLRPVMDLDGDLWFTTLPRKGPSRFRDGLGYLIASGPAQLIQVAE